MSDPTDFTCEGCGETFPWDEANDCEHCGVMFCNECYAADHGDNCEARP